MTHGAIDLGKKMSQVCILTEDGGIIERRIRTERERFASVFQPHPGIRILVEAGTESEWVARCLEELGHEVIVADPNYAPMYAQRQRKIKTDRRDARALVEACRLGAYRPAHRTSDAQRQVRWHIATRERRGPDAPLLGALGGARRSEGRLAQRAGPVPGGHSGGRSAPQVTAC